MDSESQAQFFVCHSEVADRSCLIQHLQSGAFVEQGDDRKLKLTLSSASAAVFSKLRAYSQGEPLLSYESDCPCSYSVYAIALPKIYRDSLVNVLRAHATK